MAIFSILHIDFWLAHTSGSFAQTAKETETETETETATATATAKETETETERNGRKMLEMESRKTDKYAMK